MRSYCLCVIHYEDPISVRLLLERAGTWSSRPASVIVIDNSGNLSRISPSWLDDRSVLIVDPGENVGYAAAANLGAEAARRLGYEVMLLLTQDADLDLETARRLDNAMVNSRAAAVVAPILEWASRPGYAFSRGGTFSRLGEPRHQGHSNRIADLDGEDPGETTVVDWVDGACLLLNLVALADVGGFRDEFFLYVEDVEIAVRLRKAGYEVVIVNDAIARQEPGSFTAYLQARNLIYVHGLHRDVFSRWMTVGLMSILILRPVRRANATALRGALVGIKDGLTKSMGIPLLSRRDQ